MIRDNDGAKISAYVAAKKIFFAFGQQIDCMALEEAHISSGVELDSITAREEAEIWRHLETIKDRVAKYLNI